MNIQNDIEMTLKNAIESKSEKFYIDELKFLKAELQRGNSKEVSDDDATRILVGLYKSQLNVIEKAGEDSPAAGEAYSLIANINDFLPESVVKELVMTEEEIEEWISKNVDFSSFKNKNMAIGFIKGNLKYTDGSLIKKILDKI